ncbi:MAG: periplasmic heavy metal sensor [Verrucomicrobiae bacterium]|nr:periplasmic heavy metal sensor [Verrucomicrobiae bacterium]
MNRWRIIGWSLGTVAAAAMAATLAVSLNTRTDPGNSEAHFHEWLHQNLEISPEQEELLMPFEMKFETDRQECRAKIEAAGTALAAAIRSSTNAKSPEVEAALQQLIAEQGELQRLTLEHFFAMKQHLSPEQGEKLLHWTHDSITDGHHR